MTAALEQRRRAYARAMVAQLATPDPALEDAFAAVPRESFLPPGRWVILRAPGEREVLPTRDPMRLYPLEPYPEVLVELDAERGINNGSPSLHALMLHALSVRRGDRILHLGAGTGYYTALLADLAGPQGRVTAVEFHDHLARQARHNLAPWPNVRVIHGDAAAFPTDDTDRIYANFAVADPPRAWFTWLRPGGIALLPLGTGLGRILRVERLRHGFAAAFLMPCGFIGASGPLAGDTAHRARLDAAFAQGGMDAVRSLHLDPAKPRQAWFRTAGWALSPEPPA
jgi:protein-L-isoaspartate(D-aspartate) O-methyltransferase